MPLRAFRYTGAVAARVVAVVTLLVAGHDAVAADGPAVRRLAGAGPACFLGAGPIAAIARREVESFVPFRKEIRDVRCMP